MDALHAVLNWLDHNRYLAIGLLVAVLLSAGIVGCQPTTASLTTPGEKVTATELEREAVTVGADLAKRGASLEADVAAYNAALAAAAADIERQYAIRAAIVETVGSLGVAAAEGTISPAAGIGAIIQLLTLGAAGGLLLDNRRKDKVITTALGA